MPSLLEIRVNAMSSLRLTLGNKLCLDNKVLSLDSRRTLGDSPAPVIIALIYGQDPQFESNV
jgi:hypothetical protein